MLIEIHMIQNHSPANLNRDDLGAPKTCYFGGVLRSRISSQCIKRSIRTSEEFENLLGGIRTRQLPKLIAEQAGGDQKKTQKRVMDILKLCGFDSKEKNGIKSKILVYTTRAAIREMAALIQQSNQTDKELATAFGNLIAQQTAVPDMALSGRMLETGELDNTTVEAALQVAHALSTHAARPEVDYYVAADDVPGDDAGAGFVDEAIFASACFYKYFSIDWEQLVENLRGNKELAAHTVGAFLRGAALANPTGKQNSFAAHNPPDGILVEIKSRNTPISYANAFANPVTHGERGIIAQSIAQLGQYVCDLDAGYGNPGNRFWFSPNLRYPLNIVREEREVNLVEGLGSFDALVRGVIETLGFNWDEVQTVGINTEPVA